MRCSYNPFWRYQCSSTEKSSTTGVQANLERKKENKRSTLKLKGRLLKKKQRLWEVYPPAMAKLLV